MLKKKLIYFLVICGSFFSTNQLLAQAGFTAAEAMQICAGVTVPAKVSSGTAEAGPVCVAHYPNPTIRGRGGTAALGSVTVGQYYMILLTNYGNAGGRIGQ